MRVANRELIKDHRVFETQFCLDSSAANPTVSNPTTFIIDTAFSLFPPRSLLYVCTPTPDRVFRADRKSKKRKAGRHQPFGS